MDETTKIFKQCFQTFVISDLNGEEIGQKFSEKNYKRASETEFRIEKQSIENVLNYLLSGRFIIIPLIVGLMKKISLYKMSYFPKQNES